MRINRRTWLASAVLTSLSANGVDAIAQSPRATEKTARRGDDTTGDGLETSVSLVLLTGATAAAEHAQAWGQRLQKFDIGFQTRQTVSTDKPQVTEKKAGRLRQVTVIAHLDRSGKIVCSDRTFSLDQAEKMAEWIRELKAYGAQGAPHGKPLFGLDAAQFTAVMKSLTAPVEVETNGLTLDAVLKQLPLPAQHPIRLTPDAERAIRELEADKRLRQSLTGLSLGTVLAASLAEFGLTFRPLRTPDAKIELSVSPRSSEVDAWPIGWPLDPSKPQGQAVPALFQIVPVELNEAPLVDVLIAASNASEVPIVVDHHAIERQGTDLNEIKITVANRKTTWGLLLKQITTPHKLGRRILTDEASRPFVLVTTLKESLKDSPAAKMP